MKNIFLATILLVSIYFLFPTAIVAQSMKIDWAVKDSAYKPYGNSRELFCDKDSNVYNYGDYDVFNNNGNIVPAGSLLEKFSTQGKLILIKKWHVPSFSIKKIIYDGNQSLYFVGFFSENCILDGISVSYNGKENGMIGKMNSSGTILWVKTFGNSKDVFGMGLCFGPSKNSLIITGNITDTLFVNNVVVDNAQQSVLIAQFSLSGALQNHKLYAFPIVRNNNSVENIGREIYPAPNGNYFMFARRSGSYYPLDPNDTLRGPTVGEYVMKLNAGFDTLWTKYITGPLCYYGYGGGPLRVSAAGDPYIPSFCSGKYGGDGIIQRLDQNNGTVTWSEVHSDGSFSDIFLDGNTLFTCGTDSITYYGPQDNGYQDIKIFNQQNIMTDIIKFNGPQYKFNVPPYNDKPLNFRNITRDNYGNTFVLGDFSFQYIIFGKDTVRGDVSDNFGDYTGNFLLKLKDKTTCTPPPMPVAANATICYNNKASLSATGTGTLGWYSQAAGGTYLGGGANYTTPKLTVSTTYYVQDSTCAASATRKAVFVKVNPLPIVIANASKSTVCAGDKVILRGSGALSFIWTGGVTNGVAFTPTTTTTYTVTGTDVNNCSNTATIKITVKPLPVITTNLNGVTITANQNGAIYQWLDCNKNKSPIAGATNQSYTAIINGDYAVIVTLNSCSDTSSCVNVATIGIDKIANTISQFNVFPNPANNGLTISFSSAIKGKFILNIMDELSQTIYTENKKDFSGEYLNTIDLSNQPKGIYFVEIFLGTERRSKKIILE